MARIPLAGWFENNLKVQGLTKAKAKPDSLVRLKPDTYDYSEKVLVPFGYKLLAVEQLKASLVIFELSTELYPASSNAFDSYAEALMVDQQKALAIQNYDKSLALDSTNNNAVKMLQKLRTAK